MMIFFSIVSYKRFDSDLVIIRRHIFILSLQYLDPSEMLVGSWCWGPSRSPTGIWAQPECFNYCLRICSGHLPCLPSDHILYSASYHIHCLSTNIFEFEIILTMFNFITWQTVDVHIGTSTKWCYIELVIAISSEPSNTTLSLAIL